MGQMLAAGVVTWGCNNQLLRACSYLWTDRAGSCSFLHQNGLFSSPLGGIRSNKAQSGRRLAPSPSCQLILSPCLIILCSKCLNLRCVHPRAAFVVSVPTSPSQTSHYFN